MPRQALFIRHQCSACVLEMSPCVLRHEQWSVWPSGLSPAGVWNISVEVKFELVFNTFLLHESQPVRQDHIHTHEMSRVDIFLTFFQFYAADCFTPGF